MIEHIEIENFRCFRSVSVPMRPLTVLIGPNDSGKTSFLTAIRRLSGTGPSHQDHDAFGGNNDVVNLKCILANSNVKYYYQYKIKIDQNGSSNIIEARNSLPPLGRNLPTFQLPSQGCSMVSSGVNDSFGPPVLQDDGSGVPGLLDYLLRRDRARLDRFVASLRTLVPGLRDLAIATPDPARRQLLFTFDNSYTTPADNASAGVRLLTFFLALAYHPSPPRIILIEEPETGLHPRRLGDVMRLLREMTQGKHGDQAVQVVLTTHSPYLLDFVDVDQDMVLVFRREDDGSRSVEPVDAERLNAFLEHEFMLGEVWYNEGETGLIKQSSS